MKRFLALGLASAFPLAAFAQFTENFDTDHTANWVFNSSIAGDAANNNSGGEANFFFDYSTVGIPLAPHSSAGGSRGLKMEANVPGTGVFSGMSASPLGQHFTGDYVLTFDAWQNFNGPFPGGGSGSTQMTLGGVGAIETQVQFPGIANYSGAFFAASGDGGTASDYRAYNSALAPAPGATMADTSGVYAAGNTAGSTNNSNAYYSAFGNMTAPAAQLTLFPQQTGNTAVGTLGMAWHTWTITKSGNTISWTVDSTPIATLTGATLGGDDIALGQFDINATSSTDTNARSLLFGLVDNVRVAPVPEPATMAVLGLGTLGLIRRRRQK